MKLIQHHLRLTWPFINMTLIKNIFKAKRPKPPKSAAIAIRLCPNIFHALYVGWLTNPVLLKALQVVKNASQKVILIFSNITRIMSYFAIKKKSDYLKPLMHTLVIINLTFVPFLVHNLIFLRKFLNLLISIPSIGKFIWSHVYLSRL